MTYKMSRIDKYIEKEGRLVVVMVNCMCPFDWAKRGPNSWLSLFLSVYVKLFWKDISIWVVRLSEEGHPHPCEWPISNLLGSQIERKGGAWTEASISVRVAEGERVRMKKKNLVSGAILTERGWLQRRRKTRTQGISAHFPRQWPKLFKSQRILKLKVPFLGRCEPLSHLYCG